MRYKCIEWFPINKYDDNGFSTEKESIVKEGTMWELSEDSFRIIGGDVHLDRIFKSKNAKTSEWIEIPKEILDNYFELIN